MQFSCAIRLSNYLTHHYSWTFPYFAIFRNNYNYIGKTEEANIPSSLFYTHTQTLLAGRELFFFFPVISQSLALMHKLATLHGNRSPGWSGKAPWSAAHKAVMCQCITPEQERTSFSTRLSSINHTQNKLSTLFFLFLNQFARLWEIVFNAHNRHFSWKNSTTSQATEKVLNQSLNYRNISEGQEFSPRHTMTYLQRAWLKKLGMN